MARGFQPSFYRWAMGLAVSDPVRMMHELAGQIYRDIGGEAVEEHVAIYAEIVTLWRRGGPDRPPMREALRAMGARERGHTRMEKLREQAWLQARAEVFQQMGERIELPQTPETFEREQSAEEAALMQQLSKQLRKVGAMAREMEEAELKEAGAPSGGGMPEKVPEPVGAEGSGSFSGGSLPEKVPEPVASDDRGSGSISRIPPREMEPDPSAQKMSRAPAPETQPDPAPAVLHRFERPSNKRIKAGLQLVARAGHGKRVCESLRQEARSGRLSEAEFNAKVGQLVGAA